MEYRELSPEELVQACTSSNDAGAWEEFVRRFHPLIATVTYRVVRRWGETTPQLVDDLVQETYLKLCADECRILRGFEPQHPGSFYGFLKVVTVNVVQDYLKSERSVKRGGGQPAPAELTETTTRSQHNAGVSVETGDRRVLMREIDNSLRELAESDHLERDRRIFWLYYRVGLTAQAISALPSIGLGVKGVESTILRLSRLLRQRLVDTRSHRSSAEGIRRSESFS